jgi:hypothetical protein
MYPNHETGKLTHPLSGAGRQFLRFSVCAEMGHERQSAKGSIKAGLICNSPFIPGQRDVAQEDLPMCVCVYTRTETGRHSHRKVFRATSLIPCHVGV